MTFLAAFLAFVESPAGSALAAAIPNLYTQVASILVQKGHITAEDIAAHLVDRTGHCPDAAHALK